MKKTFLMGVAAAALPPTGAGQASARRAAVPMVKRTGSGGKARRGGVRKANKKRPR